MRFNIILQHLLPQHALSRLAGWIANCRWHWLKTALINDFIRRYQVDLRIAALESVDDYPHFNSFFTRKLKPQLRPIAKGLDEIVSPVDGCVSQAGNIQKDLLFQAKGHFFSLPHLLGDTELAKHFQDGTFATFYLAPKDYHRVHMPQTGTLIETIYVPGQLFSVNQQTTENVTQLFTRNERLVCLFKTEIGFVAIILVGAMLVSGIKTVWPLQLPTKTLSKKHYQENITLEKGTELGHFTMGSTVILLFPKNTMQWSNTIQANAAVQMGTSIGKTVILT
jgi:phosphatidylserine decarboxylase